MTNAMAVTCVVIGIILAVWAVMLWLKKHRENKNHSRWVTFLLAVAGIFLGTGAGDLSGVDFARADAGYVPVWLIVVAVVGFLFVLEAWGWRDHHVRTPILGFLTAVVLFAAIGSYVVTGSVHEIHRVQTTDQVTPASGGKG